MGLLECFTTLVYGVYFGPQGTELTMGCGGFAVVFSVGLPSGDPLGVSQGPNWPQKRLKRTRNCTKTKEIYRENSL